MHKIVLISVLFLFQTPLFAGNFKPNLSYLTNTGVFYTSLQIKGFLTGDNFFEYYGLRLGKSVNDKFLSGIEVGKDFYGQWERTLEFGIFGRYYFYELGKLDFFAELQYLFGLMQYKNPQTEMDWNGFLNNGSVNFGLSFTGLFKRQISLSFISGYGISNIKINNHPVLGKYQFTSFDFSYQFQISFFF